MLYSRHLNLCKQEVTGGDDQERHDGMSGGLAGGFEILLNSSFRRKIRKNIPYVSKKLQEFITQFFSGAYKYDFKLLIVLIS